MRGGSEVSNKKELKPWNRHIVFLLGRNPFSKTSSPDLGGGFILFNFHPENWGKINEPNLTFAHFSDGLVPPPTNDSLRYTSAIQIRSFFGVCSRSCSKSGKGLPCCLNSCSGTLKLKSVLKGCCCFFFVPKSFSLSILSIPKGGWVFSFRISEASYMLHLKTSGAAAEC